MNMNIYDHVYSHIWSALSLYVFPVVRCSFNWNCHLNKMVTVRPPLSKNKIVSCVPGGGEKASREVGIFFFFLISFFIN